MPKSLHKITASLEAGLINIMASKSGSFIKSRPPHTTLRQNRFTADQIKAPSKASSREMVVYRSMARFYPETAGTSNRGQNCEMSSFDDMNTLLLWLNW